MRFSASGSDLAPLLLGLGLGFRRGDFSQRISVLVGPGTGSLTLRIEARVADFPQRVAAWI